MPLALQRRHSRLERFGLLVLLANIGIGFSLTAHTVAFGAAAPSTPSSVQACRKDSPDLAAYWSFNEGSGSTVNDSAGINDVGTTHGTKWSTATAPVGYADSGSLMFNGTGAHVSVGNAAGLGFESTSSFSGTAWINTTTTSGTQTVFQKLDDTNTTNRGYFFTLTNGIPEVWLIHDYVAGNYIRVAATVTVTPNAWTHLAVTYDGSRSATGVKIYVNGLNVTNSGAVSNALSGSILNTQPFEIGYRSTAQIQPFSGKMDDVRIYNTALSGGDVAFIANGTCDNSGSSSSSVSSGSGSSVSSGSGSSSSTSSSSVSATTIVVTPSGMHGWAFISSGTLATGHMTTGPATPPLGVGSAELDVAHTNSGSVGITNRDYSGTLLSRITALSYDTYVAHRIISSSSASSVSSSSVSSVSSGSGSSVSSGSGSSVSSGSGTSMSGSVMPLMAPEFVLLIARNGSGSTMDRLTFDPTDQTGAGLNSSGVIADQWHHWNAYAGLWRMNNGVSMTLTQYKTLHPAARIMNGTTFGGVTVAMGGSGAWASTTGYTDNVHLVVTNVRDTTYDFDPDSVAAASSSSVSTPTNNGNGGGSGGGSGGGRRVTGSSSSAGIPPGGFGGGNPNNVFSDVSGNSYYNNAVNDFIRNGFLDTTQSLFRPGDYANRAEMVKLMIEMKGGILNVSPHMASFDDVRPGTWYYDYFEDAGTRGIVQGDSNCYGNHPCTARPASPILRAEIAAMIDRAFNLQMTGAAPSFSDVQNGQWYTQWIQIAADHCLIQGDANTGRARPLAPINRADLITMLDRTMHMVDYHNGCTGSASSGALVSITPLSSNVIRIAFNQDVSPSMLQRDGNYLVSCGKEVPVSSVTVNDPRTADVHLGTNLQANQICRFTVSGLTTTNNGMVNDSLQFHWNGSVSSSSSHSSSSSRMSSSSMSSSSSSSSSSFSRSSSSSSSSSF